MSAGDGQTAPLVRQQIGANHQDETGQYGGGCMNMRNQMVLFGYIGLIAAMLTGIGEFLLHYDPLSRFSDNEFFLGISATRTTLGHFAGVLGAPLYLVGCWHIRLMLQPASERWSLIAFAVSAYGFAVGFVWIGSRASISALINTPASPELEQLIAMYDFRYETLLQFIRIAVLGLSIIYVWLVLTGKSHYPKWMAVINPILLIAASFVVYAITPSVGKFLMPIALNVAFFVFFLFSISYAKKVGV
jgi:hypothetical protein